MSCSVVVPVHNEAADLEKFVLAFWDGLDDMQAEVAEILLVENGSTDGTLAVVRSLENRLPGVIRAHSMDVPSYGEAVRYGLTNSASSWVCILECDVMQAEFVRAACECINTDADFVVASKRHADSVDNRPLKRRALTYLFNTYLRMRLGFSGTDTHGLKAIRTPAAKRLAELCITSGEVLQTELVLLAERLGYKIVEVPLRLEERRCPAVSITKRIPKVARMIGELKDSLARFPR